MNYETILEDLKLLGKMAIAFSGGVDSSFLLRAAIDALGCENVLALTADTTLQPLGEKEEIVALAEAMGARHLFVEIDPLSQPEVQANSRKRCYYCKQMIYSHLWETAKMLGFFSLADGANASDVGEYRPGRQAAAELGVLSPLQNILKNEIRALSEERGLPTAQKPSAPCLATRLPYGQPLVPQVLRQIDAGEKLLREAGFSECRLRHHGDLARIEVPISQIRELFARQGLADQLCALGYRHVTADLQGLRHGCYDQREETL